MKTESPAVVAVRIAGIVFLVIGLFRLPYSVIVGAGMKKGKKAAREKTFSPDG